jgi:hypothetical protein
MGKMVESYLRLNPPRELYSFLESNFLQLQSRHGGVVGLKVPIPKLIPLSRSA